MDKRSNYKERRSKYCEICAMMCVVRGEDEDKRTTRTKDRWRSNSTQQRERPNGTNGVHGVVALTVPVIVNINGVGEV